MISFSRFTVRIAVLLSLALCGCSWIHTQSPAYSPDISEIIHRIEAQNRAVTSANGLASATITDRDKTHHYRLAWAVEKPDRLRLIVLFSGKPIETLLHQGSHLLITSHTGSHETIRKRSKNPNLEKLISLPLRVSQMISILSGDIPLPGHRSARLENKPDGRFILILLKRFEKPAATFYLDGDKKLMACEFTDSKDNIYRIEYKHSSSPGALPMTLPESVSIHNKNRSLVLRIDQLHPNPSLSPETFEIISN